MASSGFLRNIIFIIVTPELSDGATRRLPRGQIPGRNTTAQIRRRAVLLRRSFFLIEDFPGEKRRLFLCGQSRKSRTGCRRQKTDAASLPSPIVARHRKRIGHRREGQFRGMCRLVFRFHEEDTLFFRYGLLSPHLSTLFRKVKFSSRSPPSSPPLRSFLSATAGKSV